MTMIVPSGNSYILNGDGVKFVNRVETLKTDFLMVHWLEAAFLHFDPVFDLSLIHI